MKNYDVRVSLPDGYAVDRVLIRQPGNYMSQQATCIISVSEAPPDPKPTFEIGKRYKTRDGRVVGPLRKNCKSWQKLYPICDDNLSWTADGKYFVRVDDHNNDLMPGAIEDECCKATASAGSVPYDRAATVKKVREGMTRASTVGGVVGKYSTSGGWDDDWALGMVLVLEALGIIGK